VLESNVAALEMVSSHLFLIALQVFWGFKIDSRVFLPRLLSIALWICHTIDHARHAQTIEKFNALMSAVNFTDCVICARVKAVKQLKHTSYIHTFTSYQLTVANVPTPININQSNGIYN